MEKILAKRIIEEINEAYKDYGSNFESEAMLPVVEKLIGDMKNDFYRMIKEYSEQQGGLMLHAKWVQIMLKQNREVSKERREWKTLPNIDKELDIILSEYVISRFFIETFRAEFQKELQENLNEKENKKSRKSQC